MCSDPIAQGLIDTGVDSRRMCRTAIGLGSRDRRRESTVSRMRPKAGRPHRGPMGSRSDPVQVVIRD